MANKNYPFEIKDVEPETEQMMMRLFSGERGGFIRVGPKGYVLTKKFEEMAADIYNMEIRSSDVFIVTYARSGTTWTQELLWMVGNDLDYETAKAKLLVERFPFIENAMMMHPTLKKELQEKNKGDSKKLNDIEFISKTITDDLAAAPSPRFIKSHLPLSLLPPNILDAKVVYVARDPRDAAVSFFHFCKALLTIGFEGDFKAFWNLFVNDLHYWTPYFEHVKEAWQMRHHKNMLFLFYEDLQKDIAGVVRRVSDFFGKSYTEEQIAGLCDHLDFKNFRNNKSVNSDLLKEVGVMKPKTEFIRRGKTGGWREYFDEEMTTQAEQWMADNLRDTDLRFPCLSSTNKE